MDDFVDQDQVHHIVVWGICRICLINAPDPDAISWLWDVAIGSGRILLSGGFILLAYALAGGFVWRSPMEPRPTRMWLVLSFAGAALVVLGDYFTSFRWCVRPFGAP